MTQSPLSDQAATASCFAEQTIGTTDAVAGYRECGAGPQTIVLLHGISSGSDSWRDCATVLGRSARVIAWDAPGYGASSALPYGAPSAPQYAARLHGLLEALQISRCLLVGHSLGALMAAAYSGLAGCRAAGFVLISPALGYQGARSAKAAQVREKRLAALHELGIEGMAQNLPARLLSRQATDEARETVRRIALRLRPDSYVQAVELLCGDDIERYCPPRDRTRVYCGENDIVTTPQQSAQYAQGQDFAFELIRDAGHACYVEQPDRVAGHILDSLAALVAPDDKPST